MRRIDRLASHAATSAIRGPRRAVFGCALLITACAEASGPLSVVNLQTEIAPATVSSGDTLVLRAILTNPSARQLEIGSACGPPVLFEVRASSGNLIYPIPLDAVFTCERGDLHVLEPGEVDTVFMRGRVTAATGQYAVRSGYRKGGGVQRLTNPVTLTIR